MFKNILVPTDGSAPSRKAIKRAVQLAREQKARITGFYVGPAWRLPVQAEFVPVEVLSPKERDRIPRPAGNLASAAGQPDQQGPGACQFPGAGLPIRIPAACGRYSLWTPTDRR